VFIVGLAVILALVLGVATAVLSAPASTFKLGQINTSNAVSTLVGAVAGSNLKIENTNTTDASATALELKVAQGKAPLTVNADAGKATNLDADELDGNDSAAFFSGSTYMVTSQPTDNSTGTHTNIALRCDIGDVALGGGYESLDPSEGTVRANGPLDVHTVFGVHQAWNVQWVNAAPSMDADVIANVRCADFGQAHQ